MDKEIDQLKDAINHCEETAFRQELIGCKECAEDHLQLAIWLRELIGYKTQNSDLESVRQELLERGDEMVSFRDLVERFDEVEEEYKGQPWNLKQIYNNFNILIGEKPNHTGKTGHWFVNEIPGPENDRVGHWIYDDDCREHGHCSECGYGRVDLVDGRPHNYCSNCGIKMEV